MIKQAGVSANGNKIMLRTTPIWDNISVNVWQPLTI